jgi:hypothetical protein
VTAVFIAQAPAAPFTSASYNKRMNENEENRTPDVTERAIGRKRICEMSGKEFLKAVAKATLELKGIRDPKHRTTRKK